MRAALAHSPLALSVLAEPLVEDARVVMVGPPSRALAERLQELGARSVHAYDPAAGELDVREGAFDVAIIPDVGRLADASGVVRRLRRLVSARGAVLAMGRARTSSDLADDAFPELAPAALEYGQLYDLFALQFEHVSMTGVLPFSGVVFAELGGEEEPAVSVDTSLAEDRQASVFVVVASASADAPAVEPYAIVQVPDEPAPEVVAVEDPALVAALAAAQLRATMLAAQLEEANTRAEATRAEQSRRGHERVEQIVAERDAIIVRATELEGMCAAQQQAILALERRLEAAEQQLLDRDDRAAALQGELDALRREGEELSAGPSPEEIAELASRAERAEAALALHVADLAHVGEAHASETAKLEAQLRERARLIGEMEKELGRREHLVRELVTALEEAREGAPGPRFEEARIEASGDGEEVARLRRKIDELAMEIARRDGELVAREWRLAELEAQQPKAAGGDRDRELARIKDELDALRQALAQEHAARVAAESGEELARARAELARQAALLDQMRNASKAS